MRICVLSDTHIPDRYEKLPDKLIEDINKSDLVIHAGDFTSFDLYQQIKHLKALKACLGNMDEPELREHVKEKEVLTIQGYKIGVMHGYGKPEAILQTIRDNFDHSFDIVIFGHSHAPLNEKIGKTLFFNPGSATDKIFAAYNTYGIIDLNNGINARIEKLED